MSLRNRRIPDDHAARMESDVIRSHKLDPDPSLLTMYHLFWKEKYILRKYFQRETEKDDVPWFIDDGSGGFGAVYVINDAVSSGFYSERYSYRSMMKFLGRRSLLKGLASWANKKREANWRKSQRKNKANKAHLVFFVTLCGNRGRRRAAFTGKRTTVYVKEWSDVQHFELAVSLVKRERKERDRNRGEKEKEENKK